MPGESIEPFALQPGEGFAVANPVGGTLTFKLIGEQCGGALTAIESVPAPGEGPPLHVHAEDELIYVLDGTLRVKVADDIVEAPTGSFVFLARNIPHTWQNVGDAPARFFAAVFPAQTGFEEFFRRYEELPEEERGVEAFARLAAETKAFEVVGPPLAVSDPL